MCGFVGLFDKNNFTGKHSLFMHNAVNDLKKRGPDCQQQWQSENGFVQLGFARLSIRDLSVFGNQPMHSKSKRYCIVYNGETYNTDELCTWAEIDKSTLSGHSDTEVILSCIESKGVRNTMQKLDGIFAIAVYDSEDSRLYLVRDHAGVKPLYMGVNEQGVVFSSHYHHVTSHDFFKNEKINEKALTNYFKYGFIQEGEGLIENTYFLPHAHITTISPSGEWSWEPYFSLKFEQAGKHTTEKLLDAYSKIVKSQLVSDVPIGCFMSGGVDSTLTTGLASKFVDSITAYTIGVSDKYLDETDEAKRFARYFNVKHELHQITNEDILKTIDDYDNCMAEPLGDFSSLLTLKVCELAKQKLTVVLSGDGGDELFWGYPRFYNAHRYKNYLSQPKYLRFINIFFARLTGKKIPFSLLKYSSFDHYYLTIQGLPGNADWIKNILITPSENCKPYLYEEILKNKTTNELNKAKCMEYDIHMQRVLLKVDRASMYHSLEVRTPMLSKVFVELSDQYQFQECVSKKEGKIPLRNALQQILPDGETNSGAKKGFSPPMANWMRNELKEKIGDRIKNIPPVLKSYINQEGLEIMWESHQQNNADYSWPLWAVYSLFQWMDNKMYNNAH